MIGLETAKKLRDAGMERCKKTGQFPASATLCDSCAWATAADCAFMRDRDIGRGLAAVGAEVRRKTVKAGTPYSVQVYNVLRCPQYKRGSLPPVRFAPLRWEDEGDE